MMNGMNASLRKFLCSKGAKVAALGAPQSSAEKQVDN